MAYQELLQNKNWLSKISLIVKRDNNECQECKNQKMKISSKKGKIRNIECIDNQLLALLNSSDSRFRGDKPKYRVDFFDELNNQQFAHIYLNGWLNASELNLLICMPLYYSENTDLNDVNYKDEKLIINGITKNKPQDWFFVRNLHVHHTYYQEGKLPWEYLDEALITLCWICHEEIHKDQTIPVLNSSGNKIGSYTYCKRCFGAGVFPEYRHIEKGIYFRCKGAKYEELI